MLVNCYYIENPPLAQQKRGFTKSSQSEAQLVGAVQKETRPAEANFSLCFYEIHWDML